MILFDSYRDVPEWMWLWKNFRPYEIRCRGTGQVLIVEHALDSLQELRNLVRRPIRITSAYRSPIYNAKEGGAPLSRHKFGDAFDISLVGHDKDELYELGKKAGFRGFGLNYKTFIHMDKWRSRTW